MASINTILTTEERRFSFVSKSMLPSHATFEVVNMKGFEAIAKGFRFEILLASSEAKIDVSSVLSNACTLTILARKGDLPTPYHGVLTEFEQLNRAGDFVFYRAVLTSKLHALTLYRASDVFVGGQQIPNILEKVLKDGGLTSSDFEINLRQPGDYRKRNFVCQYQETDLDFFSRWIEKEGLYYYFAHGKDIEKMMVINHKSLQPESSVKVIYRPIGNFSSDLLKNSVQSFICRQKPLPKQVVLQGFNYSDAKVNLKQIAPVSSVGRGDVMLYGENFLSNQEGEIYAKTRAQEIICNSRVFFGESTAVGLRCGYFMDLEAHYRGDFDGKYLVTEITHEGSQAGALLMGVSNPFGGVAGETTYFNSFRAISSELQFRPDRTMSRPHIAGTVSAVVLAEGSATYADMDEFGQYKVKLPFSKTANNVSARIRMATPYAGRNHGMNLPLLKGAEVLLSFIDGDPDQPVIMAAVSNSENPSVVNNQNPSINIIKTAGGNALTFDDTVQKQNAHLFSPVAASHWRLGAASLATLPVSIKGTWATWGAHLDGAHLDTQGSIGLNAQNAMVMKVGHGTHQPTHEPALGSLQILTRSTLLNAGNQSIALNKPTNSGVLDVYAQHINMYAEPSTSGGVTTYGYMMISGSPTPAPPAPAPGPPGPPGPPCPTPAPAPAPTAPPVNSLWTIGDLYARIHYDIDTGASIQKGGEGVTTLVGGSKTSYTKGHSNSATYGDSASVTRGNSTKLIWGADVSHSMGMSNSLYFGMKNDITFSLNNSISLGMRNDVFAGAKTSMTLSAELKLALSAVMDFSLGIKMGINGAPNLTLETALVAAVAAEMKAKVTALPTAVTVLGATAADLVSGATAVRTFAATILL